MVDTIQEKIMEFEKHRQMLLNVSMQKQQLDASLSGLGKALEELEKTKETTVYKAAGNILVLRDKGEVKKELEETKEIQSLRQKTMDAQEKNLVEKLNKLKTEIESSAEAQQAPTGETVKSSKKETK